jgi:ABC-type multidrug transport system fused ATPase/permease subunit
MLVVQHGCAARLGVFRCISLLPGGHANYGRAAKRTTKEVQEALEEFSGDVQERVAGIQVVKSFAAERRESKSFFHGARGLYQLTIRSVRISALSQSLTQGSPRWRR